MIVIKIFFLKIKIKPFSMVEETNYHNSCHNPIFNLLTQVCKIIHMTIQKIQRDINSSIVPNQQIMKWVANILLCSTYNTKNFVNLIWCILVLVLWVIWRLAQFTRASRSRKSMKNGSVLFFFKTLADDVNFWNTWMLSKKWFLSVGLKRASSTISNL